MQQQQSETARFMAALDAQCKRWWIDFATQAELRDYAAAVNDGEAAEVYARSRVRSHVANRLLIGVNAAVKAGICTYNGGPTL